MKPFYNSKNSYQLIVALLFLTGISLFSTNSYSATYYVNSSTGSDLNSGTSGSPFKTFYKAYTVAVSGDEINLTGTFDWTAADETGDASSTGFSLGKNLTINGNNAGTTFIQAAASDNIADRRVFTVTYGYTVTLSNCTIRYGKSGDGGGIQVDGTLNANYCDISYNRATGTSGGGVNCRGRAVITNSLISYNFANNMGGGLNRDYYSGNNGTPGANDLLIIINSTIAYNQVLASLAYMEGGGVFFRRGAGSLTNCTVSYNKVTNVDSSTNGIGTGDNSSVVTLKNNIIANNIRFNCWSGDIGLRQSTSSGSYIDNGNNIYGVKGYYSSTLTPSSTSWLDHTSNCQTPDGVFVLQNGQNCRSGSLYLSSTLALNGSTNGIMSFEITDANSIAVNTGSSAASGSITIPTTDIRDLSRVDYYDIGAFEYQTSVPLFAAPVGGTASASQVICVGGSVNDITLNSYTGSIQWMSSTDNSTFTNISGATSATLTAAQIGTFSGTKYFKAKVTNSGCFEYSNTVTVEFQTVTITGNNIIYLDHTSTYTANVAGAASNPWTTDNVVYATVNSSGQVTGASSGSIILTFTSNGGCTATKSIDIVPVVWNGTTSTAWSTASNWNGQYVPTVLSAITIDASAVNDLYIDANKTIGSIKFNGANKKIVLGNFDLTITIANSTNATNYIQTTGTGKLKITIGNSASATFPVGNASYDPVTITNNSGASDVFSVQVVDAVYLNGTSGTEVSTTVVDRTWNISKTNANGGSGIDFVFNWNTGEVINGSFTDPRMNHHTGTNWEVPTVASTVYGSNSLTVSGYTGTFSPFAISDGSSALPVEMVYFRANCEGSATDIQWQTATEHNSSHFILEKSVDGINWSETAKYLAAGNSTTAIDYEFVDDSKLSRELVYYRLLQFDLDGKSAIYGPISSSCQDVKAFEMVVAPNPNNGQFTLQMASMESQDVKMELYNSNGLLVEIKSLSINKGVSMECIDLGQLKPGIYNLQIHHNNGISNRKISIQ